MYGIIKFAIQIYTNIDHLVLIEMTFFHHFLLLFFILKNARNYLNVNNINISSWKLEIFNLLEYIAIHMSGILYTEGRNV